MPAPRVAPRVTPPEPSRALAWDRLAETGDDAAVRDRLAAHYLTLAEQGERALRGPQQATWLARLSVEHDNLLAALRWSATRGDGETALRLGGALASFWKRKALLAEGRAALTLVLAPTPPSELAARAAHRAKALRGAGELASLQGDRVTAHRLLGESVALWRGLDDKAGLAYALVALGAIAPDTAHERALYEEALALSQEQDDEWGIAHALIHHAAAARDRHDYTTASSLGEEALTRLRRVGDRWQIAFGLLHLGISAL